MKVDWLRCVCDMDGAAAGIRTRVVGLEGHWTLERYVLDQARLRPHIQQNQQI